jgi:hypothetical protein
MSENILSQIPGQCKILAVYVGAGHVLPAISRIGTAPPAEAESWVPALDFLARADCRRHEARGRAARAAQGVMPPSIETMLPIMNRPSSDAT